MEYWVQPDQVFDGHRLHRGKAVRLCAGRITEIADPPRDALRISGLLSPGYVDLQVNGGGGVMLNTAPTRDGIRAIAAAHRRFGTTALLPTLITDHADVLDKTVNAVIAAKNDEGILGLHIEGPHISLARRGTHAGHYVRPMDDRTLNAVARLRQAAVRVMITVAPENTSFAQITALSDMGAVVSLGHTDATAKTTDCAFQAGARCVTHLFNAMSQMAGRAPGVVGAALNSECYAGIICDGHHVADEMVGLALRASPSRDRLFLVSDAMATVGGPASFSLYGQTITLENGRLINDEGSLAGAHITQAQGVQRLVRHVGVPLVDALRMATSIPATCIGAAEAGHLVGQSVENVILLTHDLSVLGTLAQCIPNENALNASR